MSIFVNFDFLFISHFFSFIYLFQFILIFFTIFDFVYLCRYLIICSSLLYNQMCCLSGNHLQIDIQILFYFSSLLILYFHLEMFPFSTSFQTVTAPVIFRWHFLLVNCFLQENFVCCLNLKMTIVILRILTTFCSFSLFEIVSIFNKQLLKKDW